MDSCNTGIIPGLPIIRVDVVRDAWSFNRGVLADFPFVFLCFVVLFAVGGYMFFLLALISEKGEGARDSYAVIGTEIAAPSPEVLFANL